MKDVDVIHYRTGTVRYLSAALILCWLKPGIEWCLAGAPGFGPGTTVLETVMMPLHHTPRYGYFTLNGELW